MTVTQFNRGQRIQNGHTLRDQTKPSRTGECPRCGHLHNETEPDHCLGTLNGVQAACCGHGTHPGYILFKNGVQIEGWFTVYKRKRGDKMGLKERILEEMITPFNREERKLIDEIMIEYKFGGLKPIYQNMTENEVREVVENLIIKNRGE